MIPKAWDDIVISGTSSSPHGHVFTDLRATVATVSDGFVKVWPHDGQPDPDGSGKIWFNLAEVTRLEVLPN